MPCSKIHLCRLKEQSLDASSRQEYFCSYRSAFSWFFRICFTIFHDFPWFSRIFMIPYVWLITYCFSWFSMTTGIFAQFLLIFLYRWCTWIHVQEENGLFITGWDSSKWVQMDVSTIEAKTSSSKIDGLGNQFSSCHVFNISSLIFLRMDDRNKERVIRSWTRQFEMLQRLCPVFARSLSAR